MVPVTAGVMVATVPSTSLPVTAVALAFTLGGGLEIEISGALTYPFPGSTTLTDDKVPDPESAATADAVKFAFACGGAIVTRGGSV